MKINFHVMKIDFQSVKIDFQTLKITFRRVLGGFSFFTQGFLPYAYEVMFFFAKDDKEKHNKC